MRQTSGYGCVYGNSLEIGVAASAQEYERDAGEVLVKTTESLLQRTYMLLATARLNLESVMFLLDPYRLWLVPIRSRASRLP